MLVEEDKVNEPIQKNFYLECTHLNLLGPLSWDLEDMWVILEPVEGKQIPPSGKGRQGGKEAFDCQYLS